MDGEYRSIRNVPVVADDDQYISIRDGPSLKRLARKPELEVLFSKASLISEMHLDIIDVLKIARTAGMITRECERDFKRRFLNQEQSTSIRLFLWIMSKSKGGLGDVLILFKLLGYRSVAMEIESNLYSKITFAEVAIATLHNAKAVETFFYNWKRYVDNNVFPDRIEALRWMNSELVKRMSEGENNSKRQLDANKFAILHVLFMPILRDPRDREGTLNNMKQLVPADLDHGAVDLVYTGCMAWSAQMEGNVARTFDKIRQFLTLIAPFNLPFLKCLFFMLAEGTYRMLALTHPENEEYRRLSISFNEQEIQMCQDFGDTERLQQRRIGVMSLVYLLLGVHFDLKVDVTLPDEKYRMLAKEYLTKMRKSLFQGIETRREAVYNLCMARLYETEDTDVAIAYASESLRLSEEATFTVETMTNIAEFKERLVQRLAEQN